MPGVEPAVWRTAMRDPPASRKIGTSTGVGGVTVMAFSSGPAFGSGFLWHSRWRGEKCSRYFFVWCRPAIRVIFCQCYAIDSARALTTLRVHASRLTNPERNGQGDHDHSQTFQSSGADQGWAALQP